jgi:hypothetical protein
MKTSRIFTMTLVLSLCLMTSASLLGCGGGGGGGSNSGSSSSGGSDSTGGGTNNGGGGTGGGGTGGTGGSGTVTAPALKFTTFSYIDTQGIGTEAFRMLIPSGWNFTGSIEWKFDNPGAPAVSSFIVQDPNGK